MHEFRVIESILNTTLDVSRDHGNLAVARVTVAIGTLRQIVPDILQFAFEAASKGTVAEGAVLELEIIPTRVLCENCERQFKPEDVFWICPGCGATTGRVLQGDELTLMSVELREPDCRRISDAN